MPKDDDISPVPSLSASRDSARSGAAVPRPRGGSRNNTNGSGAGGRGGLGPLSAALLGVSLLIALGACIWAWQLQERLTQAGHTLDRYENRIASLEDRLADTDEGMSQNAAVQRCPDLAPGPAAVRTGLTRRRKPTDDLWPFAPPVLVIVMCANSFLVALTSLYHL